MTLYENIAALLSIGLIQLLAVISPGPSFLIVARTAVAHSQLEGIKIAIGLAAGTVIWSGAALIGLNSLFQHIPVLFSVMKVIGALFLMWIAVQTFRHAKDPLELDFAPDTKRQNAVLKGFLTQLANPKVAVFFGSIFIALLPQHVPAWMVIALIAIVSFNEFWWYSAVSLCCGAGPIRNLYIRIKSGVDRVTGVFLGALGLKLLIGSV